MCSIIILRDAGRSVLGMNFDYTLGHGLVAVHPRGGHKCAQAQTHGPQLSWTARFGAVTFNSISLELPVCGMNEAGLCVAMTWHDGGDFGSEFAGSRIDPLQWIQYQLDTSGTVEDVVRSLDDVRPWATGFPLHYACLDRTGHVLFVELVGGDLVLHRNPEIPVLTNSTYQTACRASPTPHERAARTTLGRFAALRDRVRMGAATVSEARQCLDAVQQGRTNHSDWTGGPRITTTVWSVVFEPHAGRVSFSSHANEDLRTFSLTDFDVSEAGEALVLDVHDGYRGEVGDLFQAYHEEANRRMVQESACVLELDRDQQEELIAIVDTLYRTGRMPVAPTAS